MTKGITRVVSKFLVLIAVVALTSGPVFAIVADPGNEATTQEVDRLSPEERQALLDEKKAERAVYKCEASSSKVDALVARYKATYEKRTKTYSNITTRVQEVLTTLQAAGYDTTNADAALNQFQIKVNETQSSWTAFENQMQLAKRTLCEGENVDDFRGELTKARNQLKEVRTVMNALRSEYQETVKPELLALREQIRLAEETDLNSGDVNLQQQN